MNHRINVVCVGGGHCNVQVLKHLRKTLPNAVNLTLVTDAPTAFFSGMVPGAISNFYTNDDITIYLEPLAKWSHAKYIEQKVTRIIGD